MLFNSYEFLFMFLPITFIIYFYLNHKKLTEFSKVFLVFSSLFFYSWWNIVYLPIILASMLFNYGIGNSLNTKSISNRNRFPKKIILIFGITSNIVLLAYFKYSDFLINNLNYTFNTNVNLLHLALPLAISFFTFQQIAYLVDSYRQETSEYDFLNYALFVTFFPQLIAGPIVHHKEMMPQFDTIRNRVVNYKNIAIGLFIFSIGLFKKVVIADQFALWASRGFNSAAELNMIEGWATSLSYTFQIYFDFSGYTDMAIGIALLFNIKLPINFSSPYKALSIQDFWRRWHITLSRFLKDYVYIPIGGNRHGEIITYRNLLATFIIGGIWHGAGWTFVFWGLLHGLGLAIHRLWNKLNIKIFDWLSWIITFNFINITWIFFRAKEWEDAINIIKSMIGLNSIVLTDKYEKYLSFLSSERILSFGTVTEHIGDGSKVLNWILVSLIIVLFFKNSNQITSYPNFDKAKILNKRYAVYFSIIFISALLQMSLSVYTEFIYFNF